MNLVIVSAKVRLNPSQKQAAILHHTLSVIRETQNFVSAYVFKHKLTNYMRLNSALYYLVREQFGLRSQMTQSIFKTVLAK